MLQAMHQPAPAAPSSASPTFAGLLAALTSRSSSPANRTPVWDDSDLADDVATLSYERALRTHARYRAPDLSDASFAPPVETVQPSALEATPAPVEAEAATARPAAARFAADRAPEPGACAIAAEEAAEDRNLKSASITIRLSKAECKQLRKRAAEAGVTVSSYLRSCTFEAEALRAMVKDTLAQLRSEPARPAAVDAGRDRSSRVRSSWWRWLRWFWPHTHRGEPAAQA
jgi:hypothetical protein